MPLFRRGHRAAVLLTFLALALAACGGGGGGDDDGAERSTDSTTSTTSTTTTTTVPPGPFAPFTGEEVKDRPEMVDEPVVVVKIGNNRFDRAGEGMIGVDEADIVIEERIEADATRFLAIFHSSLPEEVGTVRSGRTTDVALLSALGNPILVYSGANGGVQGQLNGLANAGRTVLVVDDGRGVNLYRDSNFSAPSNLFADLEFLTEKFGDQAGAPTPIVSFASPIDEARPEGEPGDGVTVDGEFEVAFVYVEGEGYVRTQDGEVQTLREGPALRADNLVIIETQYVRSDIDPDSIDAVTTGTGAATLLIGGESWTGTWERPTRDDGYRLLGDDGTELLLDPGRTWISLAVAGTYELEVDAETAALARNGDR